MNEGRCGIPEERWIDWHLKRLPAEAAAALSRHLAQCADCRQMYEQWGQWLSTEEGATPGQRRENRAPERQSPGCLADRVRQEERSPGSGAAKWYPSDRIRKLLRLQVAKRSLRRRLKQRSTWWIGGAAALLLLLAGMAMRGMLQDSGVVGPAGEVAALPPMTYAELHVPEGAAMMAQPDTRMVAVVPAFLSDSPDTVGKRVMMVWVNGRTRELFILLEGVLPAGSRDIQAWGTIKQQRTNLGLLEFHRAQGHLYSHDRDLPEMEELAFTIEPKGGSSQPTAPETARVKLSENP